MNVAVAVVSPCIPQDGDEEINKTLLDFSYFLATDNLEEAFRKMKVGCWG